MTASATPKRRQIGNAIAVLHTLNNSGSERGLSYYQAKLECPKKAFLDRQLPPTPLTSFSQLAVGIIGHAYLDHWFKAQLAGTPPYYVEFDDLLDDKARQLAQRACTKFLEMWAAAPFGEVVGTEEPLEGTVGTDTRLTGRLDLLVDIRDKADIGRLLRGWNPDGTVNALKPGLWIADYKFRGATYGNQEARNVKAWQAVAYPHLHPKDIQGTLFVNIITTKEIKVNVTVVEKPKARQVSALEKMILYADSLSEVLTIPTDSACFPYGRVCKHIDVCGGR